MWPWPMRYRPSSRRWSRPCSARWCWASVSACIAGRPRQLVFWERSWPSGGVCELPSGTSPALRGRHPVCRAPDHLAPYRARDKTATTVAYTLEATLLLTCTLPFVWTPVTSGHLILVLAAMSLLAPLGEFLSSARSRSGLPYSSRRSTTPSSSGRASPVICCSASSPTFGHGPVRRSSRPPACMSCTVNVCEASPAPEKATARPGHCFGSASCQTGIP